MRDLEHRKVSELVRRRLPKGERMRNGPSTREVSEPKRARSPRGERERGRFEHRGGELGSVVIVARRARAGPARYPKRVSRNANHRGSDDASRDATNRDTASSGNGAVTLNARLIERSGEQSDSELETPQGDGPAKQASPATAVTEPAVPREADRRKASSQRCTASRSDTRTNVIVERRAREERATAWSTARGLHL